MGKTTKENKLNGLDIEGLNKCCTLLKEQPAMGKSQFRIKNQWKSGGNNRVEVHGFYAAGEEQSHKTALNFEADEPLALCGTDKGANPVEYLLSALSSCMTSSIIYHATAKGYHVESLESEFEGELDIRGFLGISKEVPKGYKKIKANFKIKTDAPEDELSQFYQYSPVYSMISPTVPIEVKIIKN